MKRLIRSILILLLHVISVYSLHAQESSKNLHFVYVAHEVTTPITELCTKLRGLQEDASEIDDALMVYLSDGKSSLVSFTNLKDTKGLGRDDAHAFVEVIAALQDANSHDVNATIDLENILSLFEEYNFVNESGKVTYNSVTFDFYVGSGFWSLGNNEKVISHLYQDFSMDKLPIESFNINVFVPKTDHLNYPEGKPFGDNNVNDINSKMKIFKY